MMLLITFTRTPIIPFKNISFGYMRLLNGTDDELESESFPHGLEDEDEDEDENDENEKEYEEEEESESQPFLQGDDDEDDDEESHLIGYHGISCHIFIVGFAVGSALGASV
eukprot:CAMPEP_0197064068 /NCGR_PEP_ID=MMETSP1384-20130603/156626_1 /TAXON_ID=29189 /ORGANISM="Ammonia sp." /LENGTH=110 /DNA_ID=CAMNT_0042500483 /DNA_START=52 /DNA_END=382 /DNA_ORIENTATION=+